MLDEEMQRILSRMWRSYTDALRLYAKYRQGQQESIQDIAKNPQRPTEAERVDGMVRWAGNAIAKGIIDDQMFEERKVAMSAQVATVELLEDLNAQLVDMNQKLDQLLLRGRDA